MVMVVVAMVMVVCGCVGECVPYITCSGGKCQEPERKGEEGHDVHLTDNKKTNERFAHQH